MSAQPFSVRPKDYSEGRLGNSYVNHANNMSFKDAVYFQKMSGQNGVIPEENTPKRKPSGQEMHISDDRVYSDLQFVLTKKLNDSS